MANYYRLRADHKAVPCSVLVWAHRFEDHEARIVGQDSPQPDVNVSTVFLGINHNFGPNAERHPLIFETMVFGGELDGEQQLYSTWEQAEAGHAEMLARVQAAPEHTAGEASSNDGERAYPDHRQHRPAGE